MKFSIGDMVVEKEDIHPHTSYNVFKVVTILNGELLIKHYGCVFDGELSVEEFESKPGGRCYRESFLRFQENELFTAQEADERILHLEAAKSKLENEFESVRSQIQEKLNQAAALVKEADALAKPFNKDFCILKSECGTLYHALNDGGWSHSSMRC